MVPADPTSDLAGDDRPPMIDLGSDFDAVLPVPRRRLPMPSWRRPTLSRSRGRVAPGWWAVPVVVVVLLIAGSASAARAPLSPVANVPFDLDASAMVSGGDAIVLDYHRGANRLSVYDLHTNALDWTAPVRVVAADSGVRVVAGVVVVSTASPAPSGSATEAFDLTSGKSLWHSFDPVVAIDVAGNLLTELDHADGTSTLQRVVPRTGRIGWTLGVPTGCATVFGPGTGSLVSRAQRAVELCLMPGSPGHPPVDTPTLRAVDLATGTVVAERLLHYMSATADILLPPDQRLRAPKVAIIGDLTLLLYNGFPPAIDAFNAQTLATEWAGTPATVSDDMSPCGDLICVTDGTTETVIDPRSGKVIPGVSPPAGADPAAGLVVAPVDPAHPDVHVYPIPQIDAGVNVSVPLAAQDSAAQGSAAQGSAAQGSAWIDIRPAGARTLTRIQQVDDVGASSCVTSGGFLICVTSVGRLMFWRLPAALH
jgi:hypothetical protein